MRDFDEFFSLIDIKEEEYESAEKFIVLRGLDEHILMANYLAAYKADGKPTYCEVATAFRYDKRIRRIIYKYIGLLEEYFRAYLCNNFSRPSELGIRTDKPLFEHISGSLFSVVVDIVWSVGEPNRLSLFERKTVFKKNLDALVKLRNAVGHNRTLITYRDFNEVSLGHGEKGNSLLLNIKNLFSLLPREIADSFADEIRSASKEGNKKLKSQVDWRLLPFLVLSI